MTEIDKHYIELTTRLRSIEAFCDFLTSGGRIRVASSERSRFSEVTSEILRKNEREAEFIRQVRLRLFPDLAEEDPGPKPTLDSTH